MSNLNDQLRKVSEALSLNFESQDWGIINSCPDRVEEFITYYRVNTELHNIVKRELFELIIASFNDLLDDEKDTPEITSFFSSFISENSNDLNLKSTIDYWKRLDNEEFHVGKLL